MLKEILDSIWCEMMYHEQIEHKRPVKIFVNGYLHNLLMEDEEFYYRYVRGETETCFGIEVNTFTDYKDEPEYYLSFEKGKFRKMYDEPIVFKPNTEVGE